MKADGDAVIKAIGGAITIENRATRQCTSSRMVADHRRSTIAANIARETLTAILIVHWRFTASQR
jgi:hypothetical protein